MTDKHQHVSTLTLAFSTTVFRGWVMIRQNYYVGCVSKIEGVYIYIVCHHNKSSPATAGICILPFVPLLPRVPYIIFNLRMVRL